MPAPVKVTYLISHVDKAVGFEWLIERIDRRKVELSFILLNRGPSHLGSAVTAAGIPLIDIPLRGKFDLPLATLRVFFQFVRNRPDVVHTHLIFADVAGLFSSWILRIPSRIYTRHSSNFNRKYHNKGYLEKISNKLATKIVAISKNVRNILIVEENVKEEKIRLINHGFDLVEFSSVPEDRVNSLEGKYNPNRRKPVVGVIARYMDWKGVEYVVDAFSQILELYPDAYLILANAGNGDGADAIARKLSQLPTDSFREIPFECDLFALYQLFDVYVHVPVDPEIEAFGQTYVEALAAGVPSVFTLSGVASEFIVDGHNALRVDYRNSGEIFDAIVRILEEPELALSLSRQGLRDVNKLFTLDRQIRLLEELYTGSS